MGRDEAEKLGLQVRLTKIKFMHVGDGPDSAPLQLGNDIVDHLQKGPSIFSPAVSTGMTLAGPNHLMQNEDPDLQLCCTLHPAVWLGL